MQKSLQLINTSKFNPTLFYLFGSSEKQNFTALIPFILEDSHQSNALSSLQRRKAPVVFEYNSSEDRFYCDVFGANLEYCYPLSFIFQKKEPFELGFRVFYKLGVQISQGIHLPSLPDYIESIGEWAFKDSGIKDTFSTPKQCRDIKDCAFQNCHLLNSFYCSTNLSTLGCRVFERCTKLNHINLEISQISGIKTGTFAYCSSLKQLTLPSTCWVLEEESFAHCTSLKNIKGLEIVTQIDRRAFLGCTQLGPELTLNCSVHLGSEVFANCPQLKILRFIDIPQPHNPNYYFLFHRPKPSFTQETFVQSSIETVYIPQTHFPALQKNYGALFKQHQIQVKFYS